MNKLKKYIYRSCALLTISSVLVGGSYVYKNHNNPQYKNQSLYAETASSQYDDNSKYEKRGTVVNVESILNVREEPSLDSPVNNTLDNGSIVNIVDEKEGWYEIEKDSSNGYVKSDYVQEHDNIQEIKAVPLDNKTVVHETEKVEASVENLLSASDLETDNNTKNIDAQVVNNINEAAAASTVKSDVPNGKLINVELTAYCNDEQCSGKWGGTTTMGTQTRLGVVAAPSSISLGSKLYIPDLSYYKDDAVFNVEDRGGAVKIKDDGTYIIDVWFPTHEQVEQFGRVRTTAYILE